MSWQSWQKVLTGAALALIGAGGATAIDHLAAHLGELHLSPTATAFIAAGLSILANTIRKWAAERGAE